MSSLIVASGQICHRTATAGFQESDMAGLLTGQAAGCMCQRLVGPGSRANRGAGRRITMADGRSFRDWGGDGSPGSDLSRCPTDTEMVITRRGRTGAAADMAGAKPGRLAGIPVRPVDGGGTTATQPPPGIIGRPVVTRHLPAVAADDGNQVRRERHLVEPVSPSSQGLNRRSGTESAGGTNSNSGGQGGVKYNTMPLGDSAGSRDTGSDPQRRPGRGRRRGKEGSNS